MASSSGQPIVYCDETLFTRHTFLSSEYSRKNEPLTEDARDFNMPPVWVIAFVEDSRGVVHTASYSESIDAQKFLGYCRQVSNKMGA